MKPVPLPQPRPTLAVRFKGEIEQAAAEGARLGDLILHLTLGDAELLKRDRAVPMADISFVGGTMTYLGVKVAKGNVPASLLRRHVEDAV